MVGIMDRKIFLELCKKNNITIAELEKNLGMSNGSLRKEGDIKSQRLKAIADYFGVSMEYLMGYEDIPADKSTIALENIKDSSKLGNYLYETTVVNKRKNKDFVINEVEMDLIQQWRNADEETKNMIVRILAFNKSENANKN